VISTKQLERFVLGCYSQNDKPLSAVTELAYPNELDQKHVSARVLLYEIVELKTQLLLYHKTCSSVLT
jgi:hypothetical protein